MRAWVAGASESCRSGGAELIESNWVKRNWVRTVFGAKIVLIAPLAQGKTTGKHFWDRTSLIASNK